MPLLIVWTAVAFLALVLLGGQAYGLLGAVGRLRREIEAFGRVVRPVLEQAQQTAARAGDVRSGPPHAG